MRAEPLGATAILPALGSASSASASLVDSTYWCAVRKRRTMAQPARMASPIHHVSAYALAEISYTLATGPRHGSRPSIQSQIG
jgi:hypothetical protein